SSRRRHTRWPRDWSSDVCSSDLDEKHKHTAGEFADHDVDLEPGTRLAAVLGDRAPVKSHHHQGFGRLGGGLREAARAEDGTLERSEERRVGREWRWRWAGWQSEK